MTADMVVLMSVAIDTNALRYNRKKHTSIEINQQRLQKVTKYYW